MRIPSSALLLVALLGAPRGGSAQAPDPFAVLESAGRVYRRATGICSDFEQRLVVPLLGQDVKGRGRLCTRRPGLFSMRFADPKGDLYLADGTSLWRYQPSTDPKQVLKIALASGPSGVDFYHDFLDSPRAKYKATYEGRKTVDGKSVNQVALTPLQKTSYRSAKLWIDASNSLLRKVEITEENGSVRTVTLRAIELNPKLADDAFRFTPPAGVQVISR